MDIGSFLVNTLQGGLGNLAAYLADALKTA